MAKSGKAEPVSWTKKARQAIDNWKSNGAKALKFRGDNGAGDVFKVEVSPSHPVALEITVKHLRDGAVPTI